MSRSSRSSPLSRRPRNSAVLPWRAASLSASISGSSTVMSGTSAWRAFSFLPSPERRILSKRLMEAPSLWGAAPLPDVEELLPHRVDHGLHAGVEVQLLEDVADVVLHR